MRENDSDTSEESVDRTAPRIETCFVCGGELIGSELGTGLCGECRRSMKTMSDLGWAFREKS
jgi:hypothetical protein